MTALQEMIRATAAAGIVAAYIGSAAAHPLDGLSPEEIKTVVAILTADGKVDAASLYPLIELKEPDKALVLAWKAGDPEPRMATVNVKIADGVYKSEVDIPAKKVVSWEKAEGQSMLLLKEFLGATQLALSNADFVAGLAKRGLKADQVFCLPLTAGSFGSPDEAGKRLMKVPCYVTPEGSNFYAKPVEGLFATVDLASRTVLKVTDTGIVPVSANSWGYTEAEIEKRVGALRPAGNPATLAQPGGSNVKIDGFAISWDIWRLRYRVDKRPGVVLSGIEVNDGKDWRQVLYQANVSEVFVPYMDPDEGWYFRTYMDSG